MNLDQAIKKIISDNGADILKERRFVGLLSDYQAFGQLPYAANMLRQIYSKGYGTKIHKLYSNKDKTETAAFLSELRNKLGFDVDMLAKVLYAFTLPVQRQNKPQPKQPNNKNVSYQDVKDLEIVKYGGRKAYQDECGGIYSYPNMEVLHKFTNEDIPMYTIRNGTKMVANFAFYVQENDTLGNKLSIKFLSIPDSVVVIGDRTFLDLSLLQQITIPNSVISIGDYAFAGCTSLQQISIPNSLTKIGNGTFISCSSLQAINIPNSVTSIGESAFKGCSMLEQIIIPNSVMSIGEGAFSQCDRLRTIYLPNSVYNLRTSIRPDYYGIEGSCKIFTTR